MFDTATDQELVQLTRQGQNLAFDELMTRHRLRTLRTAMSLLRNEPDAQDEVQNTWWKVFLHINQFHEEAQFTTWLTRITINQCLMRLREKRRSGCCSLEGDQQSAFQPQDPRPQPEAAVLRWEAQETVSSELKRIPKAMREVATLCDIDGLPGEAAARRLGISVGAAKSRLRRARTLLRQRLTSPTRVASCTT
jgi:RNA polymerase sigma-70 factor, ECF subfamily